jgi:hypothetical protein
MFNVEGAKISGEGKLRHLCRTACQAVEKAQNGNGQLLPRVGMDLGLAPRGLGF